MAAHNVRAFCIALCTSVLLLIMPNRSQAENVLRIRTESTYVHAVLSDASRRSPILLTLVQRIAESNVIVYVTCERFDTTALDGRTIWGSASADVRYLRVQVNCMLSRPRLVAILAHELQHVAEVAAVPDVVDVRSFARLFRVIGYSTCWRGTSEQFETAAALAAGDRVRDEYLHRRAVGVLIVASSRTDVALE
jgi:hypothetical protein